MLCEGDSDFDYLLDEIQDVYNDAVLGGWTSDSFLEALILVLSDYELLKLEE